MSYKLIKLSALRSVPSVDPDNIPPVDPLADATTRTAPHHAGADPSVPEPRQCAAADAAIPTDRHAAVRHTRGEAG